jgi:myo-inositol-hexaphosphate 3-phosphohydrolase
MQPLDGGGIEVFSGEEDKAPMGIAMDKRPSDGNLYAIVGRKDGPEDGTYLWQYLLESDEAGKITATKVREFGRYSGEKEIEAIAVDAELGYVYYSDETVGVRKYFADPDSSNAELAIFATSGFERDHEGISIYKQHGGTGYILVSDQQANKFHLFSREGTKEDPHNHLQVKTIDGSTINSDGNEVTAVSLNENFPKGLFVAMSDDKTFHFYSWKDIMEK